MHSAFNRSRRKFLYQTTAGIAAFTSIPGLSRGMADMQNMVFKTPNRASPNFKPDVEIEMLAQQTAVSIFPGQQTRVMRYTGRLLQGPRDSVTDIPGSYLGPILNLEKGQKVRIHLKNNMDEENIIHWHGLHVPAIMDGHPMNAIPRGETYVYEFEILNRAGAYIYHPHTHEKTASQVYYGMAGAILVRDEEEKRLGLPSGEFEIPIIIQDRSFDAQNQLLYIHMPMQRMTGFQGDVVLVNGKPNAQFDVAGRAYRLRVVNASNARIYKLGWDDGMPVTVIGVDGGLLAKPVSRPYVMLAPGERLDVWADFSGRKSGTELTMRSLPFSGALPAMAERMMGGGMRHGMAFTKLAPGSEFPIFKIRIVNTANDSPSLPATLSKPPQYDLADVANAANPVPITISEAHMAMLLNGKPYQADDFLPQERMPLNTVQLLEIAHAHGSSGGHGNGGMGMMGRGMMGRMGGHRRHAGDNESGHGPHGRNRGMMAGGMGGMGGMGAMMSMAHPIHLHGQQFRILSRSSPAVGPAAESYATVRDGFIDSGLKDTVLVMPGERVHIIKPFQDYKGVFMFHCHNLEHEDMGMMREFLIE
ncbi:MAG: multicopper oxidase family protein [Gammaproteobacteria bacterium]